MFFEGERIIAVRQMILAEDLYGRKEALAKLLPMQKSDFEAIFKIMRGLPVTIRLLDPPLHEFLPREDDEFEDVANAIGMDVKKLKQRANELHEFNPMLGHRGCRLGITYPEIYEMQARAIFEAAIAVEADTGETVVPEIMIPLVATESELAILREKVEGVAKEVFAEKDASVDYMIGTMIELPRAAIAANKIANSADFFSFGTNDLTQTAIGISRDDAGRFLDQYVKMDIFAQDPFVSIDVDGVGELVKLGAERGRATKADLKLGICGEHGGDPASVEFCHNVGLDYVSCSPFRVPIARLAAAQAALK
jgi:pyruvate,orthophosphate dikinase